MILIYDSVLPSHSIPTLIGLLGMIAVVYIFQGIFEQLRTRILGDVAVGLDIDVSPQVHRAVFSARQRGVKLPGNGLMFMRDQRETL